MRKAMLFLMMIGAGVALQKLTWLVWQAAQNGMSFEPCRGVGPLPVVAG